MPCPRVTHRPREPQAFARLSARRAGYGAASDRLFDPCLDSIPIARRPRRGFVQTIFVHRRADRQKRPAFGKLPLLMRPLVTSMKAH